MTIAFRFTSADLERMPEIDGVRYEIVDGELLVSRQPVEQHQYVCTVLTYELHGWDMTTGRGMTVIAPGLAFSNDDDVIPDLVWISHERRAQALDAQGHYRIAPELVIEVLSPGALNERRDREVKLGLYSRRNVQEYWIANWREHTVDIYRATGVTLNLVATLSDGDIITSPLLPGFACPVTRLWAAAPNQ